jgi:phage gpG-like protein
MIRIDNDTLNEFLIAVVNRVGDPTPAYNNLGEYLQLRTRDRFDRETGPKGVSWKPIKANYKAYKARKGYDTGINKRTKFLRDTLTYQSDRSGLLFGSPLEYAEFPEGSRPYLAIDARDEFEFSEILYSFLDG